MLRPRTPVSVTTSVSTSGDSPITPLAVRCGSLIGTRTARTSMLSIRGEASFDMRAPAKTAGAPTIERRGQGTHCVDRAHILLDTRPTMADEARNDVEARLHAALDNMPGALVYTDEALAIVVCNQRFREMYPVPAELLEPGRPYTDFLHHLAEHGYYGPGDPAELVA